MGPTLRAGVDYKCFQCCASAQGDYPIAIALEGEAIYEIEQCVYVCITCMPADGQKSFKKGTS